MNQGREHGYQMLRDYIDEVEGRTVGRKFTTEEMIENTSKYMRDEGRSEQEIESFVYNQRLKKY